MDQLLLQYGALGAIILSFFAILKWVLNFTNQLIKNNREISETFALVITNHMAHIDSHIQEDLRVHEKTNQVLTALLEEFKRSKTEGKQ